MSNIFLKIEGFCKVSEIFSVDSKLTESKISSKLD